MVHQVNIRTKKIINLYQQKNDFHLDAGWNFCATSHGKNAYDGAVETTKQEVTKTSLQRPSW